MSWNGLNGDDLQVSVEAYDQVAAMATNAAYLYYMGDQWKIGKVAEIPPAKLRKADNIFSSVGPLSSFWIDVDF